MQTDAEWLFECPIISSMCLRYSRVKSMLHEPDDPLMVKIWSRFGKSGFPAGIAFSTTSFQSALTTLKTSCPSCALVWSAAIRRFSRSRKAANNAAIFTKLAANICLLMFQPSDVIHPAPSARRPRPVRSINATPNLANRGSF